MSDSEYNDPYNSNANSYSEQFYGTSPYNFDTDNDLRSQKNLASSLDMEFISPLKANDFAPFSSVTNLNEYF